MSKWNYIRVLFVDGPWAGEYHEVINGQHYVMTTEKWKWGWPPRFPATVTYERVKVGADGTVNGYPVTRNQVIFATKAMPRGEI